jgi:hypothetical protein
VNLRAEIAWICRKFAMNRGCNAGEAVALPERHRGGCFGAHTAAASCDRHLPKSCRSGIGPAMQKLGLSAAFLVCAALVGCQAFTAQETVSEPDPSQVKRDEKAIPKDDVHAKALAQAKAKEAAAPGPAVETATASHILIRYAGALRTTPDVTRSKEDAKKLAEQLVKKLQGGADFTALANEFTEDPSGKTTGGKLGTFPRGRMVPEFDKPVFALPPGGVSDVVETAFGYHIIKREN